MSSRRNFIRLAGAAAVWPTVARAQQTTKLPIIGFLGPNTRSAAEEWIKAFELKLRELGWIEGRTVAMAYRWVEGHDERFAELAAELVALKVDVIVTSGTPAVMALQRATSVIPIVFATAGDPVTTGLVASLARPGGNTTGLATVGDELAGKRLELLREVVPHLGRLAVMGNVTNKFTILEMGQIREAARALGIEVISSEVRRAEDIVGTFKAISGRPDALYVCTDAAIIHTNRAQINNLALGQKLPTMQGSPTWKEGL